MSIGTTLSRLGTCAALLMIGTTPARHNVAAVEALLAGSNMSTGVQAASGNVRYRIQPGSGGKIVERSTDGGLSWRPVLSPASSLGSASENALAVGAGTCSPVLYSSVATLVPGGAGVNQLYVATDGEQGNYLDGACAGTTGGLFAVGSAGAAHALGTTGLPFDQDPVGRTNRSYSIDLIVPDPAHPGTLYVHAGAGTGPNSPPAGLYKSIDSGASWREIDTGLQSSTVITNSAGVAVPVYDTGSLTISDASGIRLQFQNDTGSYSSTDAGAHWESLGATHPALAPVAPNPLQVSGQPNGIAPIATPSIGGATAQATAASPVAAPEWSWTALSPSGTLPAPRQDAAVAWDSINHQLLAFGGANVAEGLTYAEMWSYAPATNGWSLLTAGPPARYGAGAAWDVRDGVFLLFGGASSQTNPAAFGDLWAFRPATDSWSLLWANDAPGGPQPRFHALVTWDSAANRLLVFGGQLGGASPELANDLWAFTPAVGATGGSWTQLNQTDPTCTIACPQLRAGAVGGWNAAAGALRVFGGFDQANSVLSDTWTWTPTGPSTGVWSQEHPQVEPPGRAGGAAAYDAVTDELVVGPGASLTNGPATDAWANASSGAIWQPLTFAATPSPQPRDFAGWVWDDVDDAFLLYGGGLDNGTALNDLWRFSPLTSSTSASPAPEGATTGGLDEGWALDNAGRVLVSPEQIAATSAAGARYVRLNFRLGNAADWTNGALLAAYDKVVNAYLAAGIQIIGLVTQEATHGSQADWTANNRENTNGNGDNAFITDAYVHGALQPLVSHFHDRVKLWELWNEPNAYQRCSGTVCSGGSFMYPSNFAALMADGYAAIKDPPPVGLGLTDVTLISGGVLGHSIGGVYSANNAGTTYLLNTYTMGMQITGTWLAFATAHQGALPLDALGQHLYIDQNLLTSYTNVSAYLGWIHEVATLFGKQLSTYVTEAAWSTRNLPQDLQAANLDTLFQAAKQSGYVPLTTWFELTDLPQNGLYFGLQDQGGTDKESYSHYQSQAALTPAAPAPTSTPTIGGYSSPTPQPPDLGSETPTPSPIGGTPIAWPTPPPLPGTALLPTGTATAGAQPSGTPDLTPATSATVSAGAPASSTPTATPMSRVSLP